MSKALNDPTVDCCGRDVADCDCPKYVATINTPGYLPQDDEPPVFDTAHEAWAYLESERERSERDATDDGLIVASECLTELRRLAEIAPGSVAAQSVHTPDWDGIGTVYGSTPGYDGSHDLGLAYCVTLSED